MTTEEYDTAVAEKMTRLLAEHGIGPVDFRDLQPGDLFTWRPEVPPKVVAGVKHLDSGASVIEWERGRYTPRGENVTLMTPGYQAYGRIRDAA